MDRKRLKTHHHESDSISMCSAESKTLDFSSSEDETLSACSHPLIPRRSPSFLTLPKEIRFLIYQYAFFSSSSWGELIHVTVERDHSIHQPRILLSKPPSPQIRLKYTRTPDHPLPVALLTTTHQVYYETLPVLYSGVSFSFGSNPTSLTFLLDRFSDIARSSILYLKLYPAPLYMANGPLGVQLSWAVLCAQIARLSSLRRVGITYTYIEDLTSETIEFHHRRYGKWLTLICAQKEPEFEMQDYSVSELEQCQNRFLDILRHGQIATPEMHSGGTNDI